MLERQFVRNEVNNSDKYCHLLQSQEKETDHCWNLGLLQFKVVSLYDQTHYALGFEP